MNLIPEWCLWCVRIKVVDQSCPQCHTFYGRVKKRKPPKLVRLFKKGEIDRIRYIRFSWES